MKGALVTGAAAAAAVALPACSPAASSDASDAKSSSKGGETTGAKHTWEVAPEPIADIAETQDFDVVVVGAGLAGINATEAAARNGAKTVVIERNTTFSVRGVDVGHIGSKHHKSNGFDLDPRVAARFLHQASHQTTNYDLIYVWASRSGEVFDYIEDLGSKNGVSMVPALSGTAKYGNWSTLSDRWRVYPDAVSFVRGGETYDMRDDGQPVNVTLGELVYNSAVDNGAEFVFEARAEQLVGDAASGITGVVATTKDGKHVQYNAKKGVILATGGYDANPELMEAWTRPEDYASSSWWNPGWGTTGDGHLMGIKAGAQMDPCPQPVMNFRWGNPDSFYDARTWNAVYFALMVNGDGKRFVREDLPFQSVSNAQNAQPDFGKSCWQVFDDTMFEGMEDAVEEFKQKGWLFEGSTPEELAAACGVDPQGLADTIARYNGFFEAGVDEDFGRDLAGTIPFTGTRFFALTTNSCVLATVGGLTIDGSCRVLDTDDRVIEGLYAVGNASGNFFAGNYPPSYPWNVHRTRRHVRLRCRRACGERSVKPC